MSNNFREHPDESTVLRFLDGELTEREAAELRGHLDGCWQCRRNLGEWQGTIDAFLRLRETVQFPADPPPPNPWMPFDQLYPPPPIPRQVVRWWNLWKFASVAAVIVVAVFAAVVVLRKPAAPPPTPLVSTLPPAFTPPPTVETRPTPIPTPSVQPQIAAASPLHSQVLAAEVLHKLGADLGEPVAIVPSLTHAIVRARALESRRRQTIQDALAKLPGVTFESNEPQTVGNRAPAPAPSVPQTPRPKLFEANLLKQLGSPAAVESFANAILDDSDTIAIRAHAIQTLDTLFPTKTQLSPPDRAIIDGIVSAHRAVLGQHVQSLRGRLQPILDGATGPSADAAAPLSTRAIELDRLLNAAFAGAQVPLTDSELAARIQSLLKDLEQ
jgi:hypothetical protein